MNHRSIPSARRSLASAWAALAIIWAVPLAAEEKLFWLPPLPDNADPPVAAEGSPADFASFPVQRPTIERFPPLTPPFESDSSPELLPPVYPEYEPSERPWEDERLPPLEEELWDHGGSHLYHPEGDRLGWPDQDGHDPDPLLRLPENYVDPEPLTFFAQFQGEAPIKNSIFHWFGPGAYDWEPRFVGYGSYQMNAIAYQADHTRSDGIGHQLIAELDLRLTGTERFHVQFRPLGKQNTGGSYYRFSDPSGYIDNSTGVPQRFWFEGELGSIFSGFLDPFAVRDVNIVGGKFLFQLQNQLLVNDEILATVVSKNTVFWGSTSNMNVQAIYAASDVDNVADLNCPMYGTNVTIDHQRAFYELSYLYVPTPDASGRDQHFAAASRTAFFGNLSYAGRALFKFGDRAGTGDGQLFVIETNYTRYFPSQPLGIQFGVFYCNTFYASQGWNSAAGGAFNRLRSTFDVNPLVGISSGTQLGENFGSSLGVQLFRHNEDESLAPEVAFQTPNGDFVFGLGMRYQRKTGKRTYLEVLGLWNQSSNPALRRDGVFVSQFFLF